jgi:hypothetical protein
MAWTVVKNIVVVVSKKETLISDVLVADWCRGIINKDIFFNVELFSHKIQMLESFGERSEAKEVYFCDPFIHITSMVCKGKCYS